MHQNRFVIGILMCLIAATTWGGLYPVLDGALKIMDPFYLTLFRFFIVAFILVILLFIIEGKDGFSSDGQMVKLWILGTLGFSSFSFLVFLGQQLAGPSGAMITAVIMSVQPMLGVIVSWVYQKVPPKKWTVFFMFSGLVGVILVISKGDLSMLLSTDTHVLAYPLILFGALSFVIYTTFGSTFSGWSTLRYTTVTTLYACVSNIIIVGLATLFGWLSIPSISMIGDATWAILYMSLIAGVLAYFTWNLGSRMLKSINAMFFLNLVPITTFIISMIQGYELTTFELIGALITIGSLIGNNLYIRRLSKTPLPEQTIKTV